MFRSAERTSTTAECTFTTAECTFTTAECTFRTAEHKTETCSKQIMIWLSLKHTYNCPYTCVTSIFNIKTCIRVSS